jgi:hypothetical protein
MPYSKLIVQKIGDIDDKAIWMLHEDFTWENGIIKVIVPAGFQCDFASIPQFALSILGDIGQEAGVVHDFLYCEDSTPEVTRGEADYIFYKICGEMGISYWKRAAMWKAVRIGAKAFWHKRKVSDPFMEVYYG